MAVRHMSNRQSSASRIRTIAALQMFLLNFDSQSALSWWCGQPENNNRTWGFMLTAPCQHANFYLKTIGKLIAASKVFITSSIKHIRTPAYCSSVVLMGGEWGLGWRKDEAGWRRIRAARCWLVPMTGFQKPYTATTPQ